MSFLRKYRFPFLIGGGVVAAGLLVYLSHSSGLNQTQGAIGHRDVYRDSEVKSSDVDANGSAPVATQAISKSDAAATAAGLQNAGDLKVAHAADLKASNAADLRVAHAADLKASNAADLRVAHAADLKASNAADLRVAHAADLKASNAADLKASHAADLKAASAQQ